MPGTAVKKKTVAKKRAVKKALPKKRTVTAKVAAKKSAAAPAKKVAAKKTASSAPRKPWGDFNPHGFRIGTDSQIIVDELLAGGATREEIIARVEKKLPTLETRNGSEKNVASLVSGMLSTLTKSGYKVTGHFQVVAPSNIQKKVDKAAATASTSKGTAAKKTAAKRAVKTRKK